MSEEFVIKINRRTLATTVDAEGFHGTDCLAATDNIQRLIKARTIEETQKDEIDEVAIVGEVEQG